MNEMMSIAIKEARKGMLKNDGGPFGAVVVKNGQIVSLAHNEVLKTFDPTAHAEINAIRKASRILKRFDLSDCELYTTSKPCPMCMGAIYWARIGKVYYGTDEDEVAKIGFDDKKFYDFLFGRDKGVELICIEHEEALKLLREWESIEGRRLY